jgi:hypothetical protein
MPFRVDEAAETIALQAAETIALRVALEPVVAQC